MKTIDINLDADINGLEKQLKELQKRKAKIEKLMKKPDGKMLGLAWLMTQGDILDIQSELENRELSLI